MARPDDTEPLAPYPVWDPAVRTAHAALAVLFVWLLLTGHFGWFPTLHLWSGYLMLAVLLFRIVWGFVGGESARFGGMLTGLRHFTAALVDLGRRRPGRHPGHNPVGAVSVMIMLVLLLAQSVTGLFFESWGEVRGPLAERVGRDTALWLSDLHGLLYWPLLAIVLVHVGAGFYHWLWKRENRLGAIFIHGRLRLPADPGLEGGRPGRALLAGLIVGLTVAAVAWFGPIQ